MIELLTQQFKCRNPGRWAVTFASRSRADEPAYRHTPLVREQLTSIALASAGRAGARSAGVLGIRVAKHTLLRLVRVTPEGPVGQVRVLGVDDFALRKGDSYATILLDLETCRPVDVLPGRDAEPLAAGLKGHPEVETICRDRAGAYAEGACSGAPQAVQAADARHPWHNLGEAVEKTVSAHHACVRTVFENAVPGCLIGQRRHLADATAVGRPSAATSVPSRSPPPHHPCPRPAPRPRRIVRWIMTDPANLTADDAVGLKEIQAGSPQLDAVTHHVRDFAAVMRELQGDQLHAWMERDFSDDLPALRFLVNGLSGDTRQRHKISDRARSSIHNRARSRVRRQPGTQAVTVRTAPDGSPRASRLSSR
ncbi:transposase [Streptomyces violascens]|uniref:transposase n=1 Tax=Streptomyces violascens TaxID=67381 RepID=UPI0036CCE2F0